MRSDGQQGELSEQQMYEAVLRADRVYDGQFFTGVVTTGIFCFPSCSCRKPRLENVRFFADREQAKRAGFRPCKRCCSEFAGGRRGYEASLVASAMALIRADATMSIAALAAAVAISPPHLMRLFRRVSGTTIGTCIREARTARAAELIAAGTPILEVAPAVGFESASGLYSAFSRATGMSPAQYRSQQELLCRPTP